MTRAGVVFAKDWMMNDCCCHVSKKVSNRDSYAKTPTAGARPSSLVLSSVPGSFLICSISSCLHSIELGTTDRTSQEEGLAPAVGIPEKRTKLKRTDADVIQR